MMKVEIIASCYGYKEGDTPSLPGHFARLLITKGKAVEYVEVEEKPAKPKAKKK